MAATAVRTGLQCEGSSSLPPPSRERVHGTVLRTLHYNVQTDGLRALYKGWTGYVSGMLVNRLIQFSTFEASRERSQRWIHARLAQHHPKRAADISALGGDVVGGTASGIAMACFGTPFDIVTQRMQVASRADGLGYRGLRDAVHSIYAEDGIRGFTVGFSATLAYIVPYSALFFAFYALLYRELGGTVAAASAALGRHRAPHATGSGNHDPDRIEVALPIAAGSLACVLATVLTAPLDMVKTRMQVARRVHSPDAPASMVRAAVGIMREHGAQGLYRGLGPRMMATTPAVALSVLLFEQAKRLSVVGP